ncbi:hypothetical protein ACFX1T_014679 [Malus domestica]
MHKTGGVLEQRKSDRESARKSSTCCEAARFVAYVALVGSACGVKGDGLGVMLAAMRFAQLAALLSNEVLASVATGETPELMPLTHILATKLGAKLTEVRKNETCAWLRPDGKTQVTIEYVNDKGAIVPIRVYTILISTQHDETVTNDEIAANLK